MKNPVQKLIGAILIVYISGCASAPSTPSTNVDLIVPTNDRACLQNRFLNDSLSRGFLPKRQSDTEVVVERPTQDFPVAILFTKIHSHVDARLTLVTVPTPTGETQIVLSLDYI